MADGSSGSSVVVHVDRTLKAAWLKAVQQLKRTNAASAAAFKARYSAIAAILEHQPPLYLAGGFASERDFLAKFLKEDHTTTYRHLRIAKLATVEEIDTLGASVLDLAIQCVEAIRGKPTKASDSIDFMKLTLPVKGPSGKPVHKPLEAVTVAELRDLLRQSRGGKSKRENPRAKQLARLLKEAGVQHATFTTTTTGATLHLRYDELAKACSSLAHFSET